MLTSFSNHNTDDTAKTPKVRALKLIGYYLFKVERYFARKLLVNPVIPAKDKLIVSREKVSEFLQWLDNR